MKPQNVCPEKSCITYYSVQLLERYTAQLGPGVHINVLHSLVLLDGSTLFVNAFSNFEYVSCSNIEFYPGDIYLPQSN